MLDVITSLHTAASSLGIEFRYSMKAGLNLLENAEDGKTYFAVFSQQRERIFSKGDLKTVIGVRVKISAMLLSTSLLENNIYNEMDSDIDTTIYNTVVSPLINLSQSLLEIVGKCDYIVTSWKEGDVYHQFDANMSGITLDFTIESDDLSHNYTPQPLAESCSGITTLNNNTVIDI